jgi:hypothetical protein
MVNNMADFINVRLPVEFVLDPKLKELVDKLALRHPTFTFGTKGMNSDACKSWSNTVPRGQRTPPREDGIRYLRKINVHCGSELLGSVSLETRYSRSNGQEIVYQIGSWRIKNERGSRNTAVTAKLDVAVRTAKNVFVPQDTKELMAKAESEINSALYQALADLRRPILHGTLVKSTLELQKYLFYHLTGVEVPVHLKHSVESSFTSTKYKTAMAEYELAEYMSAKPCMFIHVHGGGYLMWHDNEHGEREAVFRTLEELPEQAQNHISVLQLMQDNELVYDVGYRLNSDNFAVLAIAK